LGYAHKMWTFPGGGVGRNESFAEAAKRETLEESGVVILNPKKIGEYSTEKEYKRDTVECFHSIVHNKGLEVDGFETVEAEWFSKDKLPDQRATQVDNILKMLV